MLNYYLKNDDTSDYTILDLGITIPASGTHALGTISYEKQSISLDLARALASEELYLYDGDSQQYVDPMTAVRLCATGGRGSLVNRDGLARVHASPRPMDHWTYFTGSGDKLNDDGSWSIGEGDRMLFNLKSTDKVKHIDLIFSEDVHVKDGFIIVHGAPFGSYLEFTILHPQVGEIVSFARKVPLLRDGWFPLDSEDSGHIQKGLTLRVSVYNSDNERDVDEEPPATFKVSCRLEMFRKTTSSAPGASMV